MVDGQPFNHLWFNSTWVPLASIALTSIDHVEVAYGPVSAVYGSNAFMGVVNVITQKGTGDAFKGRVDLMTGTLDQGGTDLSIQAPLGSWRLSVSGRYFQGGMDAKAGNQYEYTSDKYLGQSVIGRQIFGKMFDHWAPGISSPYSERSTDIRLSNGPLEFGIQHLGLKSTMGMNYPTDRYLPASGIWYQFEWAFWAQHSTEITPGLDSKSLVRYRRSDISAESADFAVTWNRTLKAFTAAPQSWPALCSAMSFNQDFEYQRSEAFRFNFGLVASHESMEKGYQLSNPGTVYQIPTASFDPALAPPVKHPELFDANHIGIERRGAYLQGRWAMDEALSQALTLGVRHDWHSLFKGATTWRAGYTGTWDSWNLKAMYGEAYEEPSHRQFFGGWQGAGSSTDLIPERSATREVSLGYTESNWSFLVDLYDIRNSDTIMVIPGGANNLGTQHIQGVDLHAQRLLHPAWGELRLWGYLTHNFRQEGDPYNTHINVLNSNSVADIAPTKLWLGLTATLAHDFLVTLKGRRFDARKTVATNPLGRIPGYTVLEAHFQLGNLFIPGLSLGVKVGNVLDAAYSHPGLRDGDAGEKPGAFDGNGDYTGSAGGNSSRLPQAGRSFDLIARYRF